MNFKVHSHGVAIEVADFNFVLLVTELVVSGTKCDFQIRNIEPVEEWEKLYKLFNLGKYNNFKPKK